jgi:probable 2-oxoglutarate dehydrogenase E1 component DHKTD1
MITLLDYPASHIFRKIAGKSDLPEEYTAGVCDAVHHLSGSNKKTFHGTGCKEKEINITVVHNPSHLEAANPVS